MFLVLYFDKTDLSMNLLSRPSGQNKFIERSAL